MKQTDLKQISGLLEKQNTEIVSLMEGRLEKQKTEIVFLMEGKLEKQKVEILSEVDGKLKKLEERILTGVADYIADSLTPILEKQDDRLAHLERHTAHPPGTHIGI